MTEADLFDAKIYLRSINDAAECVDHILEREVARSHYRWHIKLLSDGLK